MLSDIIKKFFQKKTPLLIEYQKIVEKIKKDELLTKRHNKYSASTKRNYAASIKRFRAYEKDNQIIYIEDIDDLLIENIHCWMMNKGYTKNAISSSMMVFKAILNRLKDQGRLRFDPSKICTGSEMTTAVYLNIDEIKRLYSHAGFTTGKARVRDIFVLHCFLGLRFNDLIKILRTPGSYLRTIDQKKYFEIKTEKTGEVVYIPLSTIVLHILEKYDYSFGKMFSLSYYNNTLKMLAKDAGINNKIVHTRTKGGRRIDKHCEKWELMGSHIGRRSFATNAFLAGIPERSIMYITGHITTQALHRYIRCSSLESAARISSDPFFDLPIPLPLAA